MAWIVVVAFGVGLVVGLVVAVKLWPTILVKYAEMRLPAEDLRLFGFLLLKLLEGAPDEEEHDEVCARE